MKNTLLLLFVSFSFTVTAQNSKLKKVEKKVEQINEKCLTLFKIIFYEDDEKSGTHIKLSAYVEDDTIYKVEERISTKNAITTSIIYLENNIPVKIIAKEDNFKTKNGKPDFDTLEEVFKTEIFVFDWKNDKAEIKRIGSPVFSDGSCSMYEYESIIENVKAKLKE